MRDISVYIKEAGPGQWVAATGVAPYFCFEAESRERLERIVVHALRFYDSVSDRLEAQIKISRERKQVVPTFSKKDKVSAKELVAA
jgi:hypothetical protein